MSNPIASEPETSSVSADDVLVLDRRMSARSVSFLGLQFAPLSPDTLFERVVEASTQGQDFGYLVTPNVDQMVRLHEQSDLGPLYKEAWATVNDSRIIELLASWSGLSLPACPGSDLTARLLAHAIVASEPVVVIGASAAVIEAVKARYGLSNLHWYQPPMGLRSNPDAVQATAQFCVDHPARFTFICVGSPQQEMVARAIKQLGGATGIGLCVGASLEFLAGTRQRAPDWMQKSRLEWLFRLMNEPRVLWRRYLVEGPKIFVIWQKWHKNTK